MVSVGLAVPRGGISQSRQTMIMVVNVQGGAGYASSLVAAAGGYKTSHSTQEVVKGFDPALLQSCPSPLRSPAGGHIVQGTELGAGGGGTVSVIIIFIIFILLRRLLYCLCQFTPLYLLLAS